MDKLALIIQHTFLRSNKWGVLWDMRHQTSKNSFDIFKENFRFFFFKSTRCGLTTKETFQMSLSSKSYFTFDLLAFKVLPKVNCLPHRAAPVGWESVQMFFPGPLVTLGMSGDPGTSLEVWLKYQGSHGDLATSGSLCQSHQWIGSSLI